MLAKWAKQQSHCLETALGVATVDECMTGDVTQSGQLYADITYWDYEFRHNWSTGSQQVFYLQLYKQHQTTISHPMGRECRKVGGGGGGQLAGLWSDMEYTAVQACCISAILASFIPTTQVNPNPTPTVHSTVPPLSLAGHT